MYLSTMSCRACMYVMAWLTHSHLLVPPSSQMTAQRCYTGAAPALEIQHAGHHIQMHGDFVPSEIQIAGPTVLFAVMTLQIAAQFTYLAQ